MSEPQMGTGSGLGPREAPGTTIVLVHGAFADASGFGGVIRELKSDGHTVVAIPNPLRGLSSDAESIATRVEGNRRSCGLGWPFICRRAHGSGCGRTE